MYGFYKINRVNELKKTSLVSSAHNGTHFGSTNAESEEGAVPIYSQHEIHRIQYTDYSADATNTFLYQHEGIIGV